MSVSSVKLGFVYVIRRPDLNKCYVGQSVRNNRPRAHLRPGNYRYDALCSDGTDPIVETVESNIPRGTELDEAERDWMRAIVEEGWTLVNRLGPDDDFRIWKFSGAQLGGKRGSSSFAALRASDPERDRQFSEVMKIVSANAHASRRSDPEKLQAWQESCRQAQKIAVERMKQRRESDPEYSERIRLMRSRIGRATGPINAAKMNTRNKTCGECGFGPSTAAGIASHHKGSGHAGALSTTPVDAANRTETGE